MELPSDHQGPGTGDFSRGSWFNVPQNPQKSNPSLRFLVLAASMGSWGSDRRPAGVRFAAHEIRGLATEPERVFSEVKRSRASIFRDTLGALLPAGAWTDTMGPSPAGGQLLAQGWAIDGPPDGGRGWGASR